MKDTVLLMTANPYHIVDEKTAEVNEGISIAYCMTSDILPHAEENGLLGYRVLKGSMPKANLKELTAVPGWYDAEFIVKPDASGKAVLKPTSLKFKKPVV